VYPTSDPRYEHPPQPVAKRSCDTSDSVYNQPRSRRRSNPTVKLVPPTLLRVPSTASADHVIVLESASADHVILLESASADQSLLESDNGCPSAWKDEEESDPNVLAWIVAQGDIAAKGDKVSYEATQKFQENWAAKLPWVECVKGGDGLFDYVRCLICSTFEIWEKILKPKWDTLKKHDGKWKAKTDLPAIGVVAGQWYIAINCKHLVNQ
jgi:hypothetical protein